MLAIILNYKLSLEYLFFPCLSMKVKDQDLNPEIPLSIQ